MDRGSLESVQMHSLLFHFRWDGFEVPTTPRPQRRYEEDRGLQRQLATSREGIDLPGAEARLAWEEVYC